MQFNSHPQKQDIVSDINFWCSTDDVVYPIEDKTRNANSAMSRVTVKIMRADSTWKHLTSSRATISIATQTLVANRETYKLEVGHIKILRLRIQDKNGRMVTLKASDRRTLSDDLLNATGTPTDYDKNGPFITLFPKPDYGAAAGLEIEYQPFADYFSVDDTIKEPGFGQDFDRLVSLYASRDYCALYNPGRLNVIDTEIKRYEDDIAEIFSSRDVDSEPAFTVARTSRGVSTLT